MRYCIRNWHQKPSKILRKSWLMKEVTTPKLEPGEKPNAAELASFLDEEPDPITVISTFEIDGTTKDCLRYKPRKDSWLSSPHPYFLVNHDFGWNSLLPCLWFTLWNKLPLWALYFWILLSIHSLTLYLESLTLQYASVVLLQLIRSTIPAVTKFLMTEPTNWLSMFVGIGFLLTVQFSWVGFITFQSSAFSLEFKPHFQYCSACSK